MKINFNYVAALCIALSLSNCKKEQIAQPNKTASPSAELSLARAAVASINVQTLYGSPYAAGALADGQGMQARFNSPHGLQLMPDGSLYVADTKNNAVRKISTDGVVSTVPLKPTEYGGILTKPVYIGVEYNTGKIHIVQDGNGDGDPYDQSWIFKPNGDVITLSYIYYVNATVLARDPYTDIFYYSQGGGITQHLAQPEGEIYGMNVPFNRDKLLYPENEARRGFSWDAIAVGYNKVVYFTTSGRIYKYTPGGVTERVFTDLNFSHITSMIFNKDSRTMYVADNGYIKRVDSGKLTVIAGPRGTDDGRDGANLTADVHANSLALGKGENIIYFTDDLANTVRSISLK
ncbi:hypothetical protein IDJ77_03445 [Mucilaginibacter sp. ZT4R22]|uniref:NHL repeat-containing protein n=1 Tax=Mucilaginibacter pankratovii TaxID=2772110 RepID=A0ABR7WKL6_9SPHI|nr:hypothetical protein [Mucilaginibacter pankratovii]MBD1362855.1 hypothetical protein [Mucilaginibacter pankratovii]